MAFGYDCCKLFILATSSMNRNHNLQLGSNVVWYCNGGHYQYLKIWKCNVCTHTKKKQCGFFRVCHKPSLQKIMNSYINPDSSSSDGLIKMILSLWAVIILQADAAESPRC